MLNSGRFKFLIAMQFGHKSGIEIGQNKKKNRTVPIYAKSTSASLILMTSNDN